MKLGYLITYVADVSITLAFFEAAFGFERRFVHPSGDYGELDTGATTLAFAAHGLAASNLPTGYTRLTDLSAPAGVEIALVTDQVDEALRKAVQAGALALADPVVKPWGQTVAYVRSPDGLVIELCTPMGS